MAIIVVERESPEPYRVEDVLGQEESGRWCMELYQVVPRLHLLSRDSTRLVCLFEAPDAEAMRSVLRTSPGRAPKHVWTADVYRAPGDRLPDELIAAAADNRVLSIAERSFPKPVQFHDVQAIEERGGWCLTVHGVEFVRSYFAVDRKRMLCLYLAPDAESVRSANSRIGLPFDCVWGATPIPPLQSKSAPTVVNDPALPADID